MMNLPGSDGCAVLQLWGVAVDRGAVLFLYYLVAASALAFLAFAAVADPKQARGLAGRQSFFLLATTCCLFAWRWPTFLDPRALNPDEGSFVAQAMKVTLDFAPWRGFDGTTSGPLNIYVLTLPALLRAPITFFSARVTAVALMAGTIAVCYLSIKWTAGACVARLAVTPLAVFLSLTIQGDFVHYSSEHLSIFLTTVGLACAAYLAGDTTTASGRRRAAIAGGLCLGSTSVAKLQAVPIACAVFFCLLVGLVISRRCLLKEKAWLAILAVFFGLLVPIAIGIWAALAGQWEHATISYIKLARAYVAVVPTAGDPFTAGYTPGVGLRFFFRRLDAYTVLLSGAILLIFVALALLIRRRGFRRRILIAGGCVGLLALSAFYAIYAPHRYFDHYLLFSIIPLTLGLASALAVLGVPALPEDRWRVIASCYLGLFILPSLAAHVAAGNSFAQKIADNPKQSLRPEATAILRYAAPGEFVAIWGWAPELWVQTRTLMATRDPATWPQVSGTAYRDYYQARYMSELRRRPPRVFVDAVAPAAFALNDRATQGHETFPELTSFISENYELKEEVNGTRIYCHRAP